MDSRLSQIKEEYCAFYKYLLSGGRLPYKETELGIWAKAIPDEVYEIFKNIELEKYDTFLDFGSGDGIVVLIASLFTDSTGIEIDKELLMAGVNIRDNLGLNAKFIHGDFNEIDIGKYDVIFIHPDKPFFRGLDEIFKDFNGILIVNGEHYLPTRMKQVKDLRKHKLNAFIYKNQ